MSYLCIQTMSLVVHNNPYCCASTVINQDFTNSRERRSECITARKIQSCKCLGIYATFQCGPICTITEK